MFDGVFKLEAAKINQAPSEVIGLWSANQYIAPIQSIETV